LLFINLFSNKIILLPVPVTGVDGERCDAPFFKAGNISSLDWKATVAGVWSKKSSKFSKIFLYENRIIQAG
jgi:hypothetical protein